MASQVSLPSTPQQNTSYDTYMQSLQQKLSSISMQNASTLLHVDSSAPTSGTTTTEMLSPVQEFETIQFPPISSPPPPPTPTPTPSSTTDTPKHTTYKNLNTELTRINLRKEPQTIDISDEIEQNDVAITTPDNKLEKTRRVSRFKVSVVVEPDPTKLIIKPDGGDETLITTTTTTTTTIENIDPDHHTALKQVPSLQDIPSSLEGSHKPADDTTTTTTTTTDDRRQEKENTTNIKLNNSVTLINNTMLQLQENVQTSYLTQAKTIIATAPTGWTTQHQHAVGIPATNGNTAHVKIERKISMDNLKTKTTTTLKKSLSYNDLANEIANLFSKPSPKIPNKHQQIERKITPILTQSNPRKITGNNRRMSKTFRRTPTIIIHPPDEHFDRINITNSCPNIHALIFKENGGVSSSYHDAHAPFVSSATKDELNHSCPDINAFVTQTQDEHNYTNSNFNSNLWKSCPSINTLNDDVTFSNTSLNDYQKYEPFNISFSECLNELDALKNEVNDIKNECECLLFGCSCETTSTKVDTFNQRNQLKYTSKRKISQKLLYKYLPNRPKFTNNNNNNNTKHDTYTRTVSEPNIFKNATRPTPSPSYNRSFSDITPKKSPKKHEITPTELLKYKIKQSLSMYDLNAPIKQDDNYDNYATIHGGMKFPKHITDFTLKNYKEPFVKVNERELDKDNNLLAIVKCCCGLENCQNGRLQVVPITFQQLMDFNCEYNMNETFEDMLGRQQAELNALIEAHRKQQIEYMKSITEVSKNSSNRKDS